MTIYRVNVRNNQGVHGRTNDGRTNDQLRLWFTADYVHLDNFDDFVGTTNQRERLPRAALGEPVVIEGIQVSHSPDLLTVHTAQGTHPRQTMVRFKLTDLKKSMMEMDLFGYTLRAAQ